MADITMCKGTDCPLREKCYRAQATPSKFRQAYFGTPPYDHLKGKCEYYAVIYDKKDSPDD